MDFPTFLTTGLTVGAVLLLLNKGFKAAKKVQINQLLKTPPLDRQYIIDHKYTLQKRINNGDKTAEQEFINTYGKHNLISDVKKALIKKEFIH